MSTNYSAGVVSATPAPFPPNAPGAYLTKGQQKQIDAGAKAKAIRHGKASPDSKAASAIQNKETKMEIMPATQEEIAEFKAAAAARYAEAGVPPKVADQLFNVQMAKVAAELDLKPTVNPEKVEKIASALAQVLNVKRAQAGPLAMSGVDKTKAGLSAAGKSLAAPFKAVGQGIKGLAGAAGKATATI